MNKVLHFQQQARICRNAGKYADAAKLYRSAVDADYEGSYCRINNLKLAEECERKASENKPCH